MSTEMTRKLIGEELKKIKEFGDNLLFAFQHDEDFPTKQDLRELNNIKHYIENIEILADNTTNQ